MDRNGLFQKLRLFSYRHIFRTYSLRGAADISASEALSMDVVRLLGAPTVSEFAAFVGISQPNATYKVKNLVKKGYLKRHKSSKDKRECRLTVSDKYEQLRSNGDLSLEQIIGKLGTYYSAEEIEIAGRVLDTACEILRQEDEK